MTEITDTPIIRGEIVDVPGKPGMNDRERKFGSTLRLARKKDPLCADGEPCVVCGRRVFPVVLQVHMGPGGGGFMPVDEPDYSPYEEMGWFAIGPECAKKLPKGYVSKKNST